MALIDLHSYLGSCIDNFNAGYGMPIGLFLVGLLGGVTHCAAMCGPFVISQAGKFERISDYALLPYHTGRIVTYITMTLIMYSLVNMLTFFTPMRMYIIVPILMFAGVLFLVNAIPYLSVIFPWVNKVTLPIPYKQVSKIIPKINNRFFLGLVLGLMPCGMVLGAIMVAASASNMLTAGLSMLAFGLGTVPALVIVAVGGGQLQNKCPQKMPVIRAGFMVWSGLWLFVMAGIMVLKG